MNLNQAFDTGQAPNERISTPAGTGFYVSNADLLSYFGKKQKIFGQITTASEGSSPSRQTASKGRFSFLAAYMAIV
jgi:hypothetical protein